MPSQLEELQRALARTKDELRREQAARRVAEARLEDATESARMFLWEVDSQHRPRFISADVQMILGLSPVEMKDHGFLSLALDYTEQARLDERLKERLDRKVPFDDLNVAARHVSGRRVCLRLSGKPIFTIEGRLRGFRGVALDVSAQQMVETRLKKSEERYQLAVESSGVGIWDWNLDSGEFFSSEATNRLLRFSPATGTAEEFFQHLEESSPSPVSDMLAQYMETREGVSVDMPITVAGAIHWLNLCGKALRDEQGEVIRVAGSVANITERKQNEAVTAKRLAQIQVLVESLPGGLLLEDANGKIALVNQRFCEMFNFLERPAQMIGQNGRSFRRGVADLLCDEDPLLCDAPGLNRTKPPRHGEILHVIDGRTIARDFLPVRNAGENNGQLWHFRDITAEEQRNSELAAARQAAAQAEARTVATLAGLGHEFRMPLNGILGAVRLMRETGLSTEQLQLAGHISANTATLLGLINDLLDFSQLETRQLSEETTAFEIAALAEEAVQLFVSRAEEKGVPLKLEMDESADICVEGNATGLRQALAYVLDNGLKLTDGGEVVLRIDCLQNGPESVSLRFAVCESGHGLDLENVSGIFEGGVEPGGENLPAGVGLGLAICSRLVEDLGGELDVSSTPGEGSVFSFVVPFQRVAGPARKPAALAESEALADTSVLLVKDRAINYLITKHQLRRSGASVELARSAREALDHLSRCSFDLILIDADLPDRDPRELARQLRQRGFVKPVFLIGGEAESTEETPGDVTEFFAKPLSLDELVQAYQAARRQQES